MTKSELAKKNFSDGYNCAQSVTLAFVEDVDMDAAALARLANGFGGGVAWTDNICGTASAIAIILALRNGKERPEQTDRQLHTYELVNAAIKEFKDALGSDQCSVLLGYNLSDPQEREKAGEAGAFHPTCDAYVAKAAEIIEKYLAM